MPNGKAVAVMVSATEYEQLKSLKEQRLKIELPVAIPSCWSHQMNLLTDFRVFELFEMA